MADSSSDSSKASFLAWSSLANTDSLCACRNIYNIAIVTTFIILIFIIITIINDDNEDDNSSNRKIAFELMMS